MITKPVIPFFLGLILGLGMWSYSMWANYGDLPAQVKQLNDDIQILKSPVDTAKIKGLDLQKLEFKIEKTEQSIREDFDWLKKFGLPLTLIALVALFYSVYKSALGFALESAKKAIEKAYLPDEEVFKRERKILVLTKEGGNTEFLRDFFKHTGFWSGLEIPDEKLKIKDGKLLDLKKVLGHNTYDLILFNEETAPFSDAEISEILEATPTFTMLFSFARPSGQRIGDNLVKDKRIASASFKSQIYGNLINALKYQKYLR